MTPDAMLRKRLADAVHDTAVPAGIAHAALSGGRTRRRRRTATALVMVTALVVGTMVLVSGLGEHHRQARVAERTADAGTLGLAWARELPVGAPPGLPFFGEDGALWSDGRPYDVPAEVNRAAPPRAVEGGWLVLVGNATVTRMAVLGPDGDLRRIEGLVEWTGFALGDASPDGRRFAMGDVVVDLVSGNIANLTYPTTEAAGRPARIDGPIGFTDSGLVYESTSPDGPLLTTTWLLGDDGQVRRIDLPGLANVVGAPPDVALFTDERGGAKGTCVSSFRLVATSWTQYGEGCTGVELLAGRGASPDGEWLLADQLPRVWNLRTGQWADLDVPQAVARQWRTERFDRIVWESDDTLLVPVVDRMVSPDPGQAARQRVQVVRCTITTGQCERAGDEQVVDVVQRAGAPTDVRFTQP